MSILSIENVSKNFSGSVQALQNVSLSVQQGEAVVIIGSSGSGKSTLLRCINNLEKVSSGKIVLDGETLVSTDADGKVQYPPAAKIRQICTKTAMVFQHFNLFSHLTCRQNVALAPINVLHQSKADANQSASALLEKVGLSAKMDAFPDQLSGGQKQRAAIARALAMNPEIMLFDEPTSALDPEITNEVTSVIVDLVKQQHTMLIVTHDLRFARSAATRIIYMDEGRIVEEGSPEQIFASPKSPRLQKFLHSLHVA